MRNDNLTHLGLAILRIGASVFLIYGHGWSKLIKLINGNTEFADPFGIGSAPTLFLAILAEVLCSFLIIIGFKTRWNAIPPAITMFVAAFMFHANEPFGSKEMALLYLVVFVAIFLIGPGKYSVDKR